MIIGETTDQYYGYEEESYDYLFKKKQGAPGPRQQKKAARKANKPAPRPGSLRQKRQDRKAGIAPKKKLIMGNFGLFNKNKKKEEAAKAAAATTTDPVTPPDADILPDAPALDETSQEQEMNRSSEANPTEEPYENAASGGPETEETEESGYDDPPPKPGPDTKNPGKGPETKGTGIGAWVGWGFLGLTVALIGYTMYRLDKMEARLPGNNDLHANP